MTDDQEHGAESRWPMPLAGLRSLKKSDVPREVAAGVTLAALIIPLNIGYAQVAGLPPLVGLYSGIIPLAVFALFTSSRHLVSSPDASIAALTGGVLMAFAPPGDPARVQYAMALALMCGGIFFVFWLFRLAFLANFLSRAVLVGFITGLGIEVFTGQVLRILGAGHLAGSHAEAIAGMFQETMTSLGTTGYFIELVELVESIPHANIYSVAIGLGAFLIVRLMKRFTPRVPGALVALVVLTVIVAVLGLDQKGVTVLGKLPPGLPSLSFPSIPAVGYLRLIPGAMAVVAISLCEGLLLVRRYSQKHGYKADGNQVLFSYGAANAAAGISGALIMGNSPSRTAAMDSAGAGSQLPSLVAAGVITVVMLIFTDTLAYLPNAALAGIVANAVLSLIEVGELRELWRVRRSEFWIAMTCLVSVLILGPLRAVIIATLLAIIDVVRRASRVDTWVLREAPDGSHFIPEKPDAYSGTGLLIYRFGASLFFANSTLFQEEIEDLVNRSDPPVRWFVLDAEAMVDVDSTGSEALHQVIKLLAARDITMVITRASRALKNTLEKYGLLELIGEERFFPTNRHALAAYREETEDLTV